MAGLAIVPAGILILAVNLTVKPPSTTIGNVRKNRSGLPEVPAARTKVAVALICGCGPKFLDMASTTTGTLSYSDIVSECLVGLAASLIVKLRVNGSPAS